MLDGSERKMLIPTKNGGIKELYHLDQNDFGNPEGITFSPDSTLYISNEAENKPANASKIINDIIDGRDIVSQKDFQ